MKNKKDKVSELPSAKMRVDKFLKIACLLKRRTVAHDVCESDRVVVNGRTAKPGTSVKVGDIIQVIRGNFLLKIRVEKISNIVRKKEADSLYTILENVSLTDSNLADSLILPHQASEQTEADLKNSQNEEMEQAEPIFWFKSPFSSSKTDDY